jgi:hypothetical protein
MRRIIRVLLAFSGACGSVAAAPPSGPTLDITPSIERRAETQVTLGQRLSLNLRNRVQSGGLWRLASDPQPNLRFLGSRLTQPQANLPDVPFDQVFEFATLKAGKTALRFEFAAPEPANAPALRVLIMTVTITGPKR